MLSIVRFLKWRKGLSMQTLAMRGKKTYCLAWPGKSGGARTIVATNRGDRWFFMYGFEKNERANIDKDELKFFQEVAKELLGFSEPQLAAALTAGEIMEVCDGNGETEK